MPFSQEDKHLIELFTQEKLWSSWKEKHHSSFHHYCGLQIRQV